METVYVTINGRKSDGDWAKTVTGVTANASTGHDWEGEWLAVGTSVDLEPGSLFVECLKSRKSTDYAVKVVLPDGAARPIAESSVAGWAQAMRKTAREWLVLTQEQRIVRAAKDWMAWNDANPTDDPERLAKRAKQLADRQAWVAQYSDNAPAANPLAQYSDNDIRAEFVRRGLTI